MTRNASHKPEDSVSHRLGTRAPATPSKRTSKAPRTPKKRGLHYPTGVTPEQFFQEWGKLRHDAEVVIEKLIDLVDAIEAPSEDLEPQGDEEDERDAEPMLGASEMLNQEKAWQAPNYAGLDEPEADTADNEPSLGSIAASSSQQFWADGTTDDREDEHDGAEPDEDAEPSLGSFDGVINQDRAWNPRPTAANHYGLAVDVELDRADYEPSLGATERMFGTDWFVPGGKDFEYDAAEDGIADEDGLFEQTGRVV